MELPDLRGLTVSQEMELLDRWVEECQARIRDIMGLGETDATVRDRPITSYARSTAMGK